ncbi:hypothetical protein QTP86_004825 [Hemibagrus guttatus]|nr:hypothetical protein QTP86_004825 [Hemibagrus guttatus]
MDQLSEEVRQESPWTMMFVDDIVICSESREQVEENLERWRFALERRGMKVSRSKTEYMCVNERDGSGTVRLQGEEVKKVQEFKYLGSTVQSNGECGKEKEAEGQIYDPRSFGPHRNSIWHSLRDSYPTRADPGRVEKIKMEEDESVAEFVLKLQKAWREEMGGAWDETAASQTLFRMMVKKALPMEVQDQLDTVVGLSTMAWPTFEANIIHYVELHRRKEREAKKAADSLVMQLHKAQLSELARNKQDIMEEKKEEKSMAKQAAVLVAQPIAPPVAQPALPMPQPAAMTQAMPIVPPQQMQPVYYASPPLTSTNFIPDRSRPGLTTTAIGAVDLQGAGGNWATVGRRSRGGRRVRRQREKRKGKSVGLRIGTLNVGTMTGKGRELADVMERRKVDILCVQESRWKGSKARSIGAGFKLFYYGVDSKRNGVGVVLKEEFVRNVLEVKRVSDRVMSLKLEIEGVMLNVVSGYAPQVGCELEEKERFWSELDEVMESIPTGERVVIGADFNGHVGEGNTGDEEVMGKFGVKERNLEGQMVVDFAKRMDMGVVNTYFQKREEHRVTYKSGGRSTQKKRSEIEKKTKWWKLKKEECCEEFRQKLRQALGGQVVLPDDWETTAEVIRETGRKVLGVSSGRRKEDKETWWWNEEVQDSIQRKRLAKKKWDMDRTEENRQEYKELQRRVKREVSKAKQKAYDELYTRLDTREGEKDLYRLARQRDRDGKDVQQKVDKIRKDEVRKALKRMKSGKAVGPDDIPVEVWKCLGEAAVEFLASLFNRVLENLEKAYDRVPREELWYCMRKSGVAEKYVRVVQDMYERSRTVVRCAVVMDQLSEEVRQESPWTMMFADDIVICSESREQVEENLERWRFALERRGMKVSRIQSNGECGKEVKKRVQAETVSLRKRQESELEVAELKMLRFSLGVTRLDRIRNEFIRGTAHVGRLGDKVRETRLRWFGHVQRRDNGYQPAVLPLLIYKCAACFKLLVDLEERDGLGMGYGLLQTMYTPICWHSYPLSGFLLGFLGFLERLFALHSGQMGALR